MAIFNSYVKLPEGNSHKRGELCVFAITVFYADLSAISPGPICGICLPDLHVLAEQPKVIPRINKPIISHQVDLGSCKARLSIHPPVYWIFSKERKMINHGFLGVVYEVGKAMRPALRVMANHIPEDHSGN